MHRTTRLSQGISEIDVLKDGMVTNFSGLIWTETDEKKNSCNKRLRGLKLTKKRTRATKD